MPLFYLIKCQVDGIPLAIFSNPTINTELILQRKTEGGAITDIAQSSLTRGGIEWWGWNSGQDLGVGGYSRQENKWRNYLRFHNRLSTRVHEFLIPIPVRILCDLCSISQTCCKLSVLSESPWSAGWDGALAQKIKNREWLE